MFYYQFKHWKPVEESRDSTTFEGSLQSKMSRIKFWYEKTDILNAKSHSNIITNLKVASDILMKELITQRKIANLHHLFVFEFESFITNRFESDL